MNEKKSSCKFDDYVQSKINVVTGYHIGNPLSKTLAQFKLDRIYPRNINMKLNLDGKQNYQGHQQNLPGKSTSHLKSTNIGENKFFNQYINLKEMHIKNSIKKNKIAQIFNIRSINLIDKLKYEKERLDIDKIKLKQKYSSNQMRRNQTEKDDIRDINLILVEKKVSSPDQRQKKAPIQKKNSVCNYQKLIQNKSLILVQKGNDSFEQKLNEYYNYLRQHCQCHGISLKQVQNYSKNSILFYIGKGNNGHLVKEVLKKRWWWSLCEDKTKKICNLTWTQLKQKSYYIKKQNRSLSVASENLGKRSQSQGKNRENSKEHSSANQTVQQISENQIHNHFQNNQFLGNKKALYYNMKAFYEKKGENVFNILPVTFHVKRYDDEVWKEFTKYYLQDSKKHQGERRLWIVKPGQNSNRGNGITIHSDYEKIRSLVQNEISGVNNLKKTFIIQKYIDKPFLYNKRKFDIRCYMLLVRLNGKIKGYWYNEGYIRTSCYQYHINDTENEFIHLTNDAIQVNSDKYGKYQDGNKLSYHNFQKYLDNTQKGSLNFLETICPKLKKIGTDSIQASYHLLGDWNGLPTFQIYGLDFMIDQNFNPWLIEINTNPCLQTSSTTLERVIPRMVDNAFKLSVDLLFPPPSNWLNSKKHYLPNRVSNNLYELVFDESKKGTTEVMKDEIIIEMGEIQQDNEVYEEKIEREGQQE